MSKLSTEGLQCIQSVLGTRTKVLSLVLLSVSFASQIFAQSATTNSVAPASLEEIIVTAQKRAQSINDVGMAINAVNDEALRQQGIKDVDDLVKIEPSFTVSQAQYGTPVYFIRGVGYNEASLAASPAVSVYVDEVPFAYPALTKGATLDISRVEVLKGPQGTLYGQNATGGAINYIAAKPTDTLEAGVEATYARFDYKDLNGFVSGPLSNDLRARFAFDATNGGAWQESYTRHDMIGSTRQGKARILLDWTPTENVKVRLNINGWVDQSDTPVTQLLAITVLDTPFASQVPKLINYPLAPLTPRAADWNPGYRHTNDEHFYQGALRADYSVSENLTLTSITSFEHYIQNNVIGNDGVSTDSNSERQTGSINSFSQELRASGNLLSNKINWLVGIDYSKDKVEEYVYGFLPYTTPAFALTPLGVPPFSDIAFSSDPIVTTKAVFANLEYQVLDTLSVHSGIRYTKSDNDWLGCLYGIDPNFAGGLNVLQAFVKGGIGVIPIKTGDCVTFNTAMDPGLQHHSLNESNVSWRVGADWHPMDKTLVYATVSKGFKAGGFPTLPGTGAIQFTPVTQESLLAYELGVKANVASQLEVTGAIFHYDYKNKQLRGRIVDPTGVFGNIDALSNIPKSLEDGAELALNWRPSQGLTLSAAATYLDARVAGTFNTVDVYTGKVTNFDGYSFPSTPKWTITSGAQYEWSVGSDLVTFLGGDTRYQTRAYSVFEDRGDVALGYPSLHTPAYGVLDLRTGLQSADHRWKVQIFGNNVTNKYYWTEASRIYDTTVRYAGMTATFGITGTYRFGPH
jgi:outer membrane receptor protein involved in Fe transport